MNRVEQFSAPFMEPSLVDDVTIDFKNYKENIKDVLDTNGFVVVKDILSKEEQTEAELLLYNDLLEAVDYDNIKDERILKLVNDIKQNKYHWPKSSIPGLVGKGFLSYHGFPHGSFAWKLRTNQKCKEVYQYLHNEEDLVVGMDMPFFNPDDTPQHKSDLWPHADQNIELKKGCENSYQGILYVWDSTQKNTSNTVLLPKSWNNEYYKLMSAKPESFGTELAHGLYVRDVPDAAIRNELMDQWKKNARRIQVPAGSLLIFNSRTIHQGFPSGYRLAQTLSWEPKSCRSKEVFINKVKLLNMGIGTTHWASLGMQHGASFTRFKKVEKYCSYHNACVIPLKKIKPYPVNAVYKSIKKVSIDDLVNNIDKEILDII